jgi:DNA primase large subunit
MEKRRARVSKERQVNTYAEMWHASFMLLQRARENRRGSYYQFMASLIFTAFTLEAYLNHIGQRIFACWNDLESLSPSKKLNVIAEKLGVAKDDSKRPFQTVSSLFKFRNDVAHGKSVQLKSEDQIRIIDHNFDDYMYEPLETRWQNYCSLKNAERAREDVEKIIKLLHGMSGITDDMLFNVGMWFGSSTLLPQGDNP